jgi:excisionase family DNA binding protein
VTGNAAPQRRLLLRPEEAAEALSVSRTTLYGLLASGAIQSVKVGGLRRIPVEALEHYVMDLSRDLGAMLSTRSTEGPAVVGTNTARAGQPPRAGLLDTAVRSEDRPGTLPVTTWTGGEADGGHQNMTPGQRFPNRS